MYKELYVRALLAQRDYYTKRDMIEAHGPRGDKVAKVLEELCTLLRSRAYRAGELCHPATCQSLDNQARCADCPDVEARAEAGDTTSARAVDFDHSAGASRWQRLRRHAHAQ